ncbi:Kinesin motor domain [Dillenia turbinata]|uniref:Kinesin motor domain n=1 Tax=Dillenia turbinata TaxID=194707 RepID=A0AAN8W8A3_9MAGN
MSLIPISISHNAGSTEMNDKDGVNIQVVLRCRPLDGDEKSVWSNCPTEGIVYDQVVSPIVNDVLEGYNCSVFAYGQTGTRETGEINKSLLMLGCIINALVEHSAHVPYRLNKGIYMPQEHYLIEESEKESPRTRRNPANTTLKEKDSIISSLQKSEKALIECTLNLRAKLENATSDVLGMFAKIASNLRLCIASGTAAEGYCIFSETHIEQLRSRQGSYIRSLEDLAGEIDGNSQLTNENMSTEEQQLKQMEEDAQLFISTKEEATAFLQKHIEQLRNRQGSYIISLQYLAGEIDRNSQLTCENLCSEECAANEERKLLEKLAELLASSNAMKKKPVVTAVSEVQVNVASRTCKFHEEMSNMQNMTSSLENDWRTFMEGTEAFAPEETAAVQDGRNELEESLRNWNVPPMKKGNC